MYSDLRHKLTHSIRRPSLAGSGLPERMRSTAFAFLGLTAAAGLALVAIFAQLGFPLLSPSPLPSGPVEPGSVSKAVPLEQDSAAIGLAQAQGAVAAPRVPGAQGGSGDTARNEPATGVDGSATPISESPSGDSPSASAPVATSPPAATPAPAPAPSTSAAPTTTTTEPAPAPARVEVPASSSDTGSKPGKSKAAPPKPDKGGEKPAKPEAKPAKSKPAAAPAPEASYSAASTPAPVETGKDKEKEEKEKKDK